jgi:hypothetical protein
LAYQLLGAVFYQKKMPAQAFTAHEKADSLEGIFSDAEMAEMQKAYETAGLSAYFRKENELRQKRLAEGRYQSPLNIALNYAFAGDDSKTLDWLERAVDEHTPWLPLAEGRYQSPLNIALNYAFAGDDSETLDWLERAVDEHTPWLPELKIDPMWDAVRAQPRFVALLKKIGLEK